MNLKASATIHTAADSRRHTLWKLIFQKCLSISEARDLIPNRAIKLSFACVYNDVQLKENIIKAHKIFSLDPHSTSRLVLVGFIFKALFIHITDFYLHAPSYWHVFGDTVACMELSPPKITRPSGVTTGVPLLLFYSLFFLEDICAQKPESTLCIVPQEPAPCFLRQSVSLGPELTIQVALSGQEALGILLSPHFWLWEYKCGPAHPVFYVGARGQPEVLMLTQQALSPLSPLSGPEI